jgi:hypothetical protein
MGEKLDLNKLRDIVHENERRGDELPASKSMKVFVDKEGDMKLGRDVSDREARVMSEVPQSVFADRLAEEGKIVRAKLPSNTKAYTTREGIKGWLYTVKCQLGTRYQLFSWYDGAHYKVMVVSPAIESKWKNPHTGHLHADATICLGTGWGTGERSLEAAFAKSVLWASGMSVALKTGKFPFNYDQT